MDIYKVKWTQVQMSLFSLLCLKVGENLTQREIARYLGVSPTTIANSLVELEKEKLITIEKNRSMNFVYLNRDNKKVIELKRVENLKNIYSSGLAEVLIEEFPGASIVLFGSYSKGEDSYKSDLDISIVGKKEKRIDLVKFEKTLNRKISIQFYPSFKEIHKNLRESIMNGIVISGGVEL